MNKTTVRKHPRKTKKGIAIVRQHSRRIPVKFSDKRTRKVPFVEPMRPKDFVGVLPENAIAEEKKDGSLTIQYIQNGAVAYLNRRGRDKTEIYPELSNNEAIRLKSKGLTITQGETYALKGKKDNFDAFLRRDLLQDPEEAKKRMKQYPLKYEAFDLLMKDGKWVTNLPLEERKKLLDETIPKGLRDVKITKYSKKPLEFAEELKKDDTVEGVVFKDMLSKYHPGKSNLWKKLKFRKEADVVITGYEPGQGKRKDIGILKVGVWDRREKKVKEVANVGTGFTDKELADLKKKLDRGERIFAKIEYLNLGSRGRLRVPSFKGLRTDITTQQTHV